MTGGNDGTPQKDQGQGGDQQKAPGDHHGDPPPRTAAEPQAQVRLFDAVWGRTDSVAVAIVVWAHFVTTLVVAAILIFGSWPGDDDWREPTPTPPPPDDPGALPPVGPPQFEDDVLRAMNANKAKQAKETT
jgi:hypothetical protein